MEPTMRAALLPGRVLRGGTGRKECRWQREGMGECMENRRKEGKND